MIPFNQHRISGIGQVISNGHHIVTVDSTWTASDIWTLPSPLLNNDDNRHSNNSNSNSNSNSKANNVVQLCHKRRFPFIVTFQKLDRRYVQVGIGKILLFDMETGIMEASWDEGIILYLSIYLPLILCL